MTGQDTIDEARQSSLPGIVRLTDQLGFTGGAQPKHVVGLSGGKDSTALDLENLQILCEDCNLGKSNRSAKDWRGQRASEAPLAD